MRMIRTLGVIILAIQASQLSAQTAAHSSEPSVELMLSLLAVDESQVLVGRFPEEISSTLYLPSRSTVLGSLTRGSGTTVLASVPGSPDLVFDEVVQGYTAAGWVLLYPHEVASSGFVSSDTDEVPYTYCRDKDVVDLGTQAIGDGETQLRTRLRSNRRGECPLRFDQSEAHSGYIPRLESPPEVEVLRTGSGSIRNGRRADTELATEMSADVLLAHYAQQLEAMGWRSTAGCFDGPLAVESWSFTSDEESRTGLLLIHDRGETTDAVVRVQSGDSGW